MERDFYTDDFEKLLREKTDQFRIYPSESVWKGIYRALHGRRGRWFLAGIVLLAGSIFTATMVFSGPDADAGANAALNSRIAQKSVEPTHSNARPKSLDNQLAQTAAPEQSNPVSALPPAEILTENAVNPAAPASELSLSPANRPNASQDAGFNVPADNHIAQLPNQPGRSMNRTNNTPAEIESLPETETVTATNDNDAAILRGFNYPLSTIKAGFAKLKPGSDLALNKSPKINNTGERELPAPIPGLESNPGTIRIPTTKPRKTWEFFASSAISYRLLFDREGVNGSTDLSLSVNQKPGFGASGGGALLIPVSQRMKIRAGVKGSYSRYWVRAVPIEPVTASYYVDAGPDGSQLITARPNLLNRTSLSSPWLPNEYVHMSGLFGVEMNMGASSSKLSFVMGATLEPSVLLFSNTKILMPDLTKYANEPSLLRKFNMNASIEGLLAVKTGRTTILAGPQYTHQLMSSYIKNYPLGEKIRNYSLKVSIRRPF